MNYSLYKTDQKEAFITLFNNTFSDSEGKDEGAMIAKLVTDFLNQPTTDDVYTFVSTNNNAQVIGGIILSRLIFPNNDNVFLLSPVAVATEYQGKGIGQKLIRFGLETLKEKGVTIAVTYGDINFYSKVGFTPINEALIQAPLTLLYPEGWIAQSLIGEEIPAIDGKPTCADALNNPIYW